MQEVVIDSNLENETIQQAESAAETWFAACEEKRIPISISDNGANIILADSNDPMCIKNAGYSKLSAWHQPIVVICKPSEKVIAHELGHVLSLREDHISPGNLMTLKYSEASTSLTSKDIEYICK